jgi:geranylgeranyl diphosphate synthase type II
MTFDLELFLKKMRTRKDYVDSCLHNSLYNMNGYPPIIHEAMNYALFNGGKRIRPIMVFEGAKIAGGEMQKVIPTACAVEMIHTYSLVHDDLPAMDDDDFRRGKPTCHRVYGEAVAILTGDALLTGAFELLAQNSDRKEIKADRVIRVIEEISHAAGSRGMIGGQVVDLESEGKQLDYRTLKTLHSLKTGELFKVSLRAGAILSGIDDKGLQALTNYAYHFGLAFQITDDILDITGNEIITGKPLGSDQKNNKTTYPTLFGLKKACQLASESINACVDSLDMFGQEADFLKEQAYYLQHRNN